MKKIYSLRRRLLTWVGVPVIAAAAIMMGLSYFYIWHEVEEVYDAQLVQSAKVLLQLTRHELEEGEAFHLDTNDTVLSHKYESKLGFRIWLNQDLAEVSSSVKNFGDFRAPPGFSDRVINGDRWRVFVYVEPNNDVQVEVSERYDVRYELITQLLSSQLLPLILFIPILFLIVWIGVSRLMRPVVAISAEVTRRGSDDLSALDVDEVPREIEPLIRALDDLFLRIEGSFQREREFTDHAAHELRTPLAAMKTQTQVLMRKFGEGSQFRPDLINLQQSIDRAAHLVDQLLSLARLQSEEFPKSGFDLSASLKTQAENLAGRYVDKQHDITLAITPNLQIIGHQPSVEILLTNILDNAFKYTPANGQIKVHLDQEGALEIRDSGPGLPNADKEAVFERFYRADKTGQLGSGLGLAIARWIARAHDTDIVLENHSDGGLSARIQFRLN